MSKRGMEGQGVGIRGEGEDHNGMDERPHQATAAQLARRKILQAKGRNSARSSRAGSPAIAQQPGFQSFQAPPSTNSFNFSVPGSTPSPMFGSGPSTQMNGTASFGGFGTNNNSNNSNASTSFSFGANLPPSQPNGTSSSSSFTFGQPQSSTNNAQSNPFSFGQPANQNQEQLTQNGVQSVGNIFNNPFGAQQAQTQETPKPTFSFGLAQTPATPASTAPGQPQVNGEKHTGTGLFGSSLVPATAAKPGQSIFSGLSSSTNGVKPGMFTQPQQNGEQVQKPLFGFAQTQSHTNGELTPKASTPFAGFGKPATDSTAQSTSTALFQQPPQENGELTSKPAFSFTGFSSTQQSTQPALQDQAQNGPISSASDAVGSQSSTTAPFSFAQTNDKPAEKPVPNHFTSTTQSEANGSHATTSFGASQQEDMSMLSPENTPRKSSMAQISEPAPATEAESQGNPNAGKSIFDRPSRDPPATTAKPTFSFGHPAPADAEQPNPNAGKSLFERLSPKDPEPPATTTHPSASLFSKPAPSSNLFSGTTPKLPSIPAAPQETDARQMDETSSALPASSRNDGKALLQRLNDGFLSFLKTQDPSKDWSLLCRYYLEQVSRMSDGDVRAVSSVSNKEQNTQVDSPKRPNGNSTVPFSTASFSGPTSSATHEPASQAKASAPFGLSSIAGNIFSTPTPVLGTNLFSQASKVPATAPAGNKRTAEEQLTKSTGSPESPVTEKRARPSEPVQYPKLSDTASNTAKLFESTINKTAPKSSLVDDTPSFGPPEDLMAQVREQKAAKEAAQRAGVDRAPFSTSGSAFKPSTTLKYAPATEPSATADINSSATSSFGFKPATSAEKPGPSSSASAPSDKPTNTDSVPSFGFKPAIAATSTSAQTSHAPSFGFKPAVAGPPATGNNNFLAAFGKQAEKEQDKAKRKRMDEDYDSEEEDKAAWEARDQAEQELKRRKIEEAAKVGTGFKFTPSTTNTTSSNTPFAFKPVSADNTPPTADVKESSDPHAGKSLFDRITPADKPAAPFGTNSFSQMPKAGSNLFAPMTNGASTFNFGAPTTSQASGTDKVPAEKEQGQGDNTWKPNTPIKFGASTAAASTTPAASAVVNPSVGLFGSSTTPAIKASDFAATKLAPPTFGFTFAALKGPSTDASRATTPGLTTDGETSAAGDEEAKAEGGEGEASEQQNDEPQIEDMTALLPEEREGNEVLFEAAIAKASKFSDKKTETGITQAWVERGKGPLYVLKSKSTGKTRVLQKIAPFGKPAMNFDVLKGCSYIHVAGKKMVKAMFVDHIQPNSQAPGKPSQWMIQVKEVQDAEKLAAILHAESQ